MLSCIGSFEGGMGGKAPPRAVFELRSERKKRMRKTLVTALAGLTIGAMGGLAIISWPAGVPLAAVTSAMPSLGFGDRFTVCGMIRQTCVVDGDTIWLDGVKIRIADIDTPEISEPHCESEYDRGIQARDRLVALLNEGPFDVTPIGGRDEDQYARKLRVLIRDGQSIGDQLVSEGLARTWTGRREPWC
jgi:micrococcal nuclease